MIRIRTTLPNGRVCTLFFKNEWVTLINHNGRSSSLSANNLLEAGQNHLNACLTIKGK